jgi:hypothetical protein
LGNLIRLGPCLASALSVDFIQNISHSECKWAIVRSLKKIMFGKGDLIYNDDYISESIYFIEVGQVRLYADNGFPF